MGVPPFEVLHKIIGRHGELLPKLNIDPMNSRIYQTILKVSTGIIEEDVEEIQPSKKYIKLKKSRQKSEFYSKKMKRKINRQKINI